MSVRPLRNASILFLLSYLRNRSEKVDGVYVQKLTIHYNCVGSIEIPDILPLPEPDVLINTRKGVAVSYPSSQKAV